MPIKDKTSKNNKRKTSKNLKKLEPKKSKDYPGIYDTVEPKIAVRKIYSTIEPMTITAIIIGLILGITSFILDYIEGNPITIMILSFLGGLGLIFGSSELVILGVKGIIDKLNWNPYLGGIISAIGAALADLVVVIFLLFKAKFISNFDEDIANNLSRTAIILILTSVIINIFFLGIAMIFVSKDKPFKLPKELTSYETTLIESIIVFSFTFMVYNLYTDIKGFKDLGYNRGFEIIVGISLIAIYIFFILILMKKSSRKTATPQTLITEFLSLKQETKFKLKEFFWSKKRDTAIKEQIKSTVLDVDINEESLEDEKLAEIKFKKIREKDLDLATLRRFPWAIVLLIFLVGIVGIILGGNRTSIAIETSLEEFPSIPVLIYSILVGLFSCFPELIVTFRGLLSKEKEIKEIGLINQVSTINQTFCLLFGFPFIISGILFINIQVSLELGLIMGAIFILSLVILLMIVDDHHFDLLEGIVVTVLSVATLLVLIFASFQTLETT